MYVRMCIHVYPHVLERDAPVATIMATSSSSTDDKLKCGICLELFQDPRSLPCLHTFCRECIQRSLLNDNRSLNCPVCRAKHELGEEGASLLPVDQHSLEKLPLQKLLLQQRSGGDANKNCGFCGEAMSPVGWCSDCKVLICSQCLALHRKMAFLKKHHIIERGQSNPPEKVSMVSDCLKHSEEKLKFLCVDCSEMVCAECLLTIHKDHKYGTLEEARQSLETKFKELADLSVTKKEEFLEYSEKLSKVEGEMAESTQRMKDVVKKTFDAIAASVEAQRNEALQTVSQRLKEVQLEKELMEISLAQIDSFTRFAARIDECETTTSYTAMATQGIKLMERLKGISDKKDILDQKLMPIWLRGSENLHVPLDKLFKLGRPPLRFDPEPDSIVVVDDNSIYFTVSLESEGLQLMFATSLELSKCSLDVEVRYAKGTKLFPVKVTSEKQGVWDVKVDIDEEEEEEEKEDEEEEEGKEDEEEEEEEDEEEEEEAEKEGKEDEEEDEENPEKKVVVQCTVFDVTEKITYTIEAEYYD